MFEKMADVEVILRFFRTHGVIDSQSVKTTEAGGPRGYGGGKTINGRTHRIASVKLMARRLARPPGSSARRSA